MGEGVSSPVGVWLLLGMSYLSCHGTGNVAVVGVRFRRIPGKIVGEPGVFWLSVGMTGVMGVTGSPAGIYEGGNISVGLGSW